MSFLVLTSQAFADEKKGGMTMAEADWASPIIATLIILGAIVVARFIHKRPRAGPSPSVDRHVRDGSNQQIINH